MKQPYMCLVGMKMDTYLVLLKLKITKYLASLIINSHLVNKGISRRVPQFLKHNILKKDTGAHVTLYTKILYDFRYYVVNHNDLCPYSLTS